MDPPAPQRLPQVRHASGHEVASLLVGPAVHSLDLLDRESGEMCADRTLTLGGELGQARLDGLALLPPDHGLPRVLPSLVLSLRCVREWSCLPGDLLPHHPHRFAD